MVLTRANSRCIRSDQQAGGRSSRALPGLAMQELRKAGQAQLLPPLPAQAGLVFEGQPLSVAEEGDTLLGAAATTWPSHSPGRRSNLRLQALLCGLFITAVFLSTNLEQALMVTPDYQILEITFFLYSSSFTLALLQFAVNQSRGMCTCYFHTSTKANFPLK